MQSDVGNDGYEQAARQVLDDLNIDIGNLHDGVVGDGEAVRAQESFSRRDVVRHLMGTMEGQLSSAFEALEGGHVAEHNECLDYVYGIRLALMTFVGFEASIGIWDLLWAEVESAFQVVEVES